LSTENTANPDSSSDNSTDARPDKSRKATLLIVFVVVFIDLLGFGIVLPLLPRYGAHFNASRMQLGLLMASFSAMQFLFAPIWGALSDRIGRRPVLMVGLLGSTFAYAMFGVATSLGREGQMLGLGALSWLFITRIAAGIAGATIATAQAVIADSTGAKGRGKGMALIGAAFGIYVKSLGKPLFFVLCLLMIPVATAELSTDGWIKELMTPVLAGYEINAAWAIVFSAGVMFLLRTFAGGVLKVFNPPMLMATSGVLSAVGLYWLGSNATGIAIFVAFLIYAIGQTYYWPCILGFVSERYPKGGALTLNLVSALALLSLGMFGNPILGVARDKSVYAEGQEEIPLATEVATVQAPYLWMTNDVIDPSRFVWFGAQQVKGDSESILANLQPIVEADEELAASVEAMQGELAEQAKDENVVEQWAALGVTAQDIEAIKVYQLAAVAAQEDEAAQTALRAALPADGDDGVDAFEEVVATHGELQNAAGRDVLKFAAIFPGILVVCFAIIALYFRSIGGYKPVDLFKGHEHDAEQAGGSDL